MYLNTAQLCLEMILQVFSEVILLDCSPNTTKHWPLCTPRKWAGWCPA